LSPKGSPASDSIDKAMEVIRQRIDGLGVAEPEVTRQGDNVVVELPGVEDREKAQQLVGRTAKLEFRPVVQGGLPFDEEAAARGDDPCAAAAGETTTTASTTSTTAPGGATSTTAPGATPTTAPGGTPSTAPSTTAPTTSAGGDSEGVGLIPPAVIDGENAAPPLRRQEDSTTSTTAPSTTAPTTPTTGAGGTTTTTTAPAGEEGAAPPEAPETVILPTRRNENEPRSCLIMGPVGFEGDSLSKAKAELGGQTGGEWVVSVDIKESQQADANALFNACFSGDTTCPSKQLAIVLDGIVQSAPVVQNQNLADDQFQITGGTGGFPQGEAKDLALVLRYGALPVEFTPSAERRVSPTLGEDSLRAGVLAGVIGLIAVALYLLFYYRALGIVVILGLGVWSCLMYGVVCWLSASRGLTLSLAGVVGIVVSLGTTVDSYIVHFERLKDEVRLGKSVRASTERGFQRAFRTILTADLASLLGASLLWWLTVGSVRGFAFFLGLSVTLDIFVAYCFDRPMVALLARSEFFTEHRIWGVARGLGRREPAAPAEPAVARA
jgi:preprotein translocase subunit SecD